MRKVVQHEWSSRRAVEVSELRREGVAGEVRGKAVEMAQTVCVRAVHTQNGANRRASICQPDLNARRVILVEMLKILFI